jgi:hypothetical protein
MTWEFITKAVHTGNSVSWEWTWRWKSQDGSSSASPRTFASFRDCVADARRHGFTGDADPSESGTLFQGPEARFRWC